MTEFTKKRYENNLKCLDVIKKFIDKYPDWRFMQILFNIGLCEDRFYEEPDKTLNILEAQYDMFNKPFVKNEEDK